VVKLEDKFGVSKKTAQQALGEAGDNYDLASDLLKP